MLRRSSRINCPWCCPLEEDRRTLALSVHFSPPGDRWYGSAPTSRVQGELIGWLKNGMTDRVSGVTAQGQHRVIMLMDG